MMTASACKKSGYCGFAAAACACMPDENIMDTALGVVSIAVSLEIPVLCP